MALVVRKSYNDWKSPPVAMMTTKAKLIINAEAGRIDRLFSNGRLRTNIGYMARSGYCQVTIGGVARYSHRIIWESVHGPIPQEKVIDHVNGDKSDNRICNLRLVTQKQNTENRKNANRDNKTSGIRGVHWDKRVKAWCAAINHNNRRYFLGYYKEISEAANAYAIGAARYHTHNPLAGAALCPAA